MPAFGMFMAIFNKISLCFVQYQTSNTVAIHFFNGRDIGLQVTVDGVMGVYYIPRGPGGAS